MIEFIVWTILIKFIIGKVIINVIVAHWLADKILKYTERYATGKNERIAALWEHAIGRVQNQGHGTKSIAHCQHGRCAIL